MYVVCKQCFLLLLPHVIRETKEDSSRMRTTTAGAKNRCLDRLRKKERKIELEKENESRVLANTNDSKRTRVHPSVKKGSEIKSDFWKVGVVFCLEKSQVCESRRVFWRRHINRLLFDRIEYLPYPKLQIQSY